MILIDVIYRCISHIYPFLHAKPIFDDSGVQLQATSFFILI